MINTFLTDKDFKRLKSREINVSILNLVNEEILENKRILEDNLLKLPCIFSNCKDIAIRSHSISRSNQLKKISDNGKIVSFETILEDKKLSLKDINKGIRTFSIFPGLCRHHDDSIFKNIDKEDPNLDDEFHFLWLYRTFLMEFSKKKILRIILGREHQLIKNNQIFNAVKQSIDDEYADYIYYKNKLNNFYKNKFCKVNYYTIIMDSPPFFVGASVFSLGEDLNGVKIQNVLEYKESSSKLCILSIPYKEKWLLSFITLEEDLKAYFSLIKFFSKENNVNHFLKMFIFFAENWGFCPKYWNDNKNRIFPVIKKLYLLNAPFALLNEEERKISLEWYKFDINIIDNKFSLLSCVKNFQLEVVRLPVKK